MTVREAPDRTYAELFEAVQSTHLLCDSKSFVDAVPRREPREILKAFRQQRDAQNFSLREFVDANFRLPSPVAGVTPELRELPIEAHIDRVWDLLTRGPDEAADHSSLIPLPNRYVVPGGRFREVYYWDSYFTMLGLAESGRVDLIREMIENFAWLIDDVGFIPNGNRSYYCTRSQPPFFSLMVELLAEISNDDGVYEQFLPQLKCEHEFWMAGSDKLSAGTPTNGRVVRCPGGLLNRYWDEQTTPRPESYAEDVELAASASRDAGQLYRDLRAGAESGWDYSSRWFRDRQSMASIRTTEVVPVDLNCLLYNLEKTLGKIYALCGDNAQAEAFDALAGNRRQLLQSLFFDEQSGIFMDLALPQFDVTGTASIATAYPLFFGIATVEQAGRVAARVHEDLLKPGGWVTSTYNTGHQWDSPNGWAPMQWIAYQGLGRYGFHENARTGAERWVANNVAVYAKHGCLLEKYNVLSSGHAGSGGEYEVQEGFGWSNAVLLKLMRELRA